MAANDQLGFNDDSVGLIEDTELGLWPEDEPPAEPTFEHEGDHDVSRPMGGESSQLAALGAGLGGPSSYLPNKVGKFPTLDKQKAAGGEENKDWPPIRRTTKTPISRATLELPRQVETWPNENKSAATAVSSAGIDFGALAAFGGFPKEFPKFDNLQKEAITKKPKNEKSTEGPRLEPFGMSGYYVEAGKQEVTLEEDGKILPAGEPHSHTYTHDHQHTHKSDHSHGHNHAHDHKATHGHDHKHAHSHSNDHKHSHAHGHKHGHDHQHGHAHKGDHKHTHSHSADHKHGHKHDHQAGHKHLHQHQHENKHAHAHTGEHKHHHHHEHHHHHHHKHTHAAEHKHGHTHKHDHKGHY
jgi:hypothetical protein